MHSFKEILAIAAARKGGAEAVLSGAAAPLPPDALAAIPDDRWLAAMARGIFKAGISWTVVENKWPGIETAFDGFAPGRVSLYDDERIDTLVTDARVIRSGPKILAIRHNAVFLRDNPGFGRRIADWPDEDYAGLLAWLGKEGSRLGGTTGQYMLRHMGKDSYVLTSDVVARLQAEGVIDGPATSAKAMKAIQQAFNRWRAESGLTFNTIGRVLAQSIDG